MNKVEEYIRGYTRGCSNETINHLYHEWLTPENAFCAAEIAEREFMEKAEKWWFDHLVGVLGEGLTTGIISEFREHMLNKTNE